MNDKIKNANIKINKSVEYWSKNYTPIKCKINKQFTVLVNGIKMHKDVLDKLFNSKDDSVNIVVKKRKHGLYGYVG